MKKLFKTGIAVLLITLSFTSCREEEEKSEVERLQEEHPNAEIEVKDGGDKIKITKEDGSEIKIKKDDGEYKKKVDNADGSEYKLKIEEGEVKEKRDN